MLRPTVQDRDGKMRCIDVKWPTVKMGSTRRVICVANLAFKFPRNRAGFRCNKFEASCWARVRNDRRAELLCPTYWCDPFGLVLVMARADAAPLSFTLRDGMNIGLEFDALTREIGDDLQEPLECKRRDFGIYQGRVVAVDYSAPAL